MKGIFKLILNWSWKFALCFVVMYVLGRAGFFYSDAVFSGALIAAFVLSILFCIFDGIIKGLEKRVELLEERIKALECDKNF